MDIALPQGIPSLLEAFKKVPDHRQASGRRHSLSSILCFMCCGMLCDAKNLLAIFEWGRDHQDWCKATFGFKRRTPCVNTLHLVIKALDISSFEAVVGDWFGMQNSDILLNTLQPLAIDGKQVRGSKTAEKSALHLLTAFSSLRGTVEVQVEVGAKANEITHAPELLKTLDLEHKVVTSDALLTQRENCKVVLSGGGDYLLEVKGNQGSLRDRIAHSFLGG